MTTEPKWSTQPPTEPGWYWCRVKSLREKGIDNADPYPAYVYGGGTGTWTDLEWYPVRIEEPPR